MKTINNTKIIKNIDKKSIAKLVGLKAGDIIVSINNEPILDFIDDNYFNSLDNLKIDLIRNGKSKSININKDATTPLGINYEENLYPPDRQCTNRCIFCFVDQLPIGMRESLYIKDDDWRYSVLFGNYVTMTNVTDSELKRIVARGASPLYVSVHAIDGTVRNEMMISNKASELKDQLKYLTDNKIIIHTQIVLCPDINDGEVFTDTIEYLASLYPYVRSLAVVPVGLTGHRENLPKLKSVSKDKAIEIINTIKDYNKLYQEKHNINFVFASDEFYNRAGMPYPMYDGGEHYPQLSNGVGMFSELEHEFAEALALYENDIKQIDSTKKITLITGVSAYDKTAGMFAQIMELAKNLDLNILKVANKHFGDSITVTGLLCGKDIIEMLKKHPSDVIIVPASTLKDGKNKFLDDVDIDQLETEFDAKILVQDIDGYAMIETIIRGLMKG